MIRPPSGLPVLSSHTQTAVAAIVNATRKASTSRVYVLRATPRRERLAASGERGACSCLLVPQPEMFEGFR
jgi:hypothetical protein